MTPEYTVETSPLHSYLSTLTDSLRARDELAGVQISSADTTPEGDAILLLGGRDEQEPGALGNLRTDHMLTIEGVVLAYRDGADEDVVREVRARAFGLIAEIETELRGSVRGHVQATHSGYPTVATSRVQSLTLSQGSLSGQRWAQIDFEILAKVTSARGGG